MEKILSLAKQKDLYGYFISAKDIVIENRVYLKCAYGCKDFGKRLNCPPHCISIDEFKKILSEYEKGIILIEKYSISKNDDISKVWDDIRKKSFKKMLEIEKIAFNEGYSFAYLLRPGSCNECERCPQRCIKPHMRRFSPEAVGVNLTKTLQNINISINYSDYKVINLVGILLLD
ncbi:DUF2284 domain-containing protein [Tepidibacter formicigenes]|uniref:Predicted metal-binding protein n=1 Tax=Tepidibacter formicigenes DSM 15518 TaxID=1123349 RepID=A0A1M6K308_9FIRM|nr:DUF2284 domain-containing protein [Tepidibacter formicigenes]SHJ53202.1 Predicted metal-binding protein [Tepidibacter formicigenes DSM 15518]